MAGSDWLVHRDGSVDEVLTTDGTWGPIENARWFGSQEEASQATLPAGTTGKPRAQHPDAHE